MNHYHRKSGGLLGCRFELTGRILCPKFRIPIFRRRVPAAVRRRRYALDDCFHAADAGSAARLPVLLQAHTSSPQTQPQQTQTQRKPRSRRQQPAPGQAQVAGGNSARRPRPPSTAAHREHTRSRTTSTKLCSPIAAAVKQWILKQYTDSAGKPLDLVQPQASERFGYPLSLFTYDPPLTAQLNSALYQVTVSGAQPTATGLVVAPSTVTVPLRRQRARRGENRSASIPASWSRSTQR